MRMTIDPGLSGTGWAVWDEDWRLVDHGVIVAPKDSNNKEKFIVSVLLEKDVDHGYCSDIHVEEPAFMEGAKGMVTARSGSLVKLLLLVGMISQALEAKLLKVRDWKGQLPKEVIIKRIKRHLPNCKARSHDWDAIGMGLYLKGVL